MTPIEDNYAFLLQNGINLGQPIDGEQALYDGGSRQVYEYGNRPPLSPGTVNRTDEVFFSTRGRDLRQGYGRAGGVDFGTPGRFRLRKTRARRADRAVSEPACETEGRGLTGARQFR